MAQSTLFRSKLSCWVGTLVLFWVCLFDVVSRDRFWVSLARNEMLQSPNIPKIKSWNSSMRKPASREIISASVEHLCDECVEIKRAYRFVTCSGPFCDGTSKFVHKPSKYQVYQYEPSVDVSEQYASKLLTTLQQIPFLLPWVGGRQCMVLWLCITVELFCSSVRIIFPRTSLHDLPCHRTMGTCSCQVSLYLVAFLKLLQRFWIRTCSCNCLISLLVWHRLWVQPKWTWSRNDVGSPKINGLSRVFSTLGWCSVSFQQILYHPRTQTRIVLSLGERIGIPNLELFPNRVLIELSRIAFLTTILLKDDRTDFAQEERLDLPYWTMILAICVLIDVSKYLGILTLEFWTMMVHLPFRPGCKLKLRQLLVLNTLEALL